LKTALIIGGGFAGCAAAHQLELLGGWDVTLVERAPFLGAGVRTQWWGGHPHTFGPRHFLTQNEDVYAYLDKLVPLRLCADHQFITYVEPDNQFYNYPIHRDDVARMPDRDQIEDELDRVDGVTNAKNLEEYWIGSVGRTLYNKMVREYNKKMWLVEDNTVFDTFKWSPKGVALKEGPRAAWDTAISGYPIAANGYDDYFDLSTAAATVLLSTEVGGYDIPNKTVEIAGEPRQFDVIVNTIAPDILFDEAYGELGFIGRDFHRIVLPMEHCFPEHVYFLYYANSEQFTRLVEYKKFTHHQSPTTLIGMEIPSMRGKYYPLPFRSEQAKAQQYFDVMPEGVFSIGRAGSYRYDVDIDDCIEQAMAVARVLQAGGWENPVPLAKHRFASDD
jgi:UDP-galactopyranose mutase